MLTGVPPTDRAPLTPSPRRRVWPWAAGSMLMMLAVIAATLVGHRLAAQARLASQVAPAPALPPLSVEAVMHALGPVDQLTIDPHAQTLVAQVETQHCPFVGFGLPPLNPPIPGCVSSENMRAGIVFYDSATGAVRGQAIKPTTLGAGVIALTDTTHSVTYLLDDGSVTFYDDATGKLIGGYASHLAHTEIAALDEQLGVIYTLSETGSLSAFDAASGQLVATATAPGLSMPELMVDASASRLYLVGGNAAVQAPMLYAYNASDLSPLGSWSLPGRLWRTGFDGATDSLYLMSVGSALTVSRLDLTTLPASQPNGPGAQPMSAHPSSVPALQGASRFGFDHASGAALAMTSVGVEAYATGAARPYAALPLVSEPIEDRMTPPPWLLPVDSGAGLAYLPGDDNTIVIASLAQPSSHAAPNALTAEVMARAGLASLLPDTNQNPPFLDARTFPLGASRVTREYYIHYSDLGWKGPYAGTASLGGVKVGATAGEYTMTFSVTWNQLFVRQHSWTVQITPDGRTHLLADSGDAIP